MGAGSAGHAQHAGAPDGRNCLWRSVRRRKLEEGRVHERKAPPDSETLRVWGQDAEGRAGQEPGLHLEGRGGGGKASI